MNAVMLVLLEVPLISFTVAPEWTPVAVERFKSWMTRDLEKVIKTALTVIGAVFIARGVITIAV